MCLLSTRQFLTAERIREAVPGYEPEDGTKRADEAFKRMFERDKAELRELGVPLETGRTSVFDTEDGLPDRPPRLRAAEVQLEPTRRPRSASPPGCGSRPSWPTRPAGRC